MFHPTFGQELLLAEMAGEPRFVVHGRVDFEHLRRAERAAADLAHRRFDAVHVRLVRSEKMLKIIFS